MMQKKVRAGKTISRILISLTMLFIAAACNDTKPAAEGAAATQSKQEMESQQSGNAVLNINLQQTTVSGLSSGAYMAHQLHIAYSDKIKGAALLAGGPYGCAKGDLNTALSACMTVKKPMDVAPLIELAKQAEEQGSIASLNNIKNHPVWIFHGSADNRVNDNVTQASVDFYTQLGAAPAAEFNIKVGHGFPTENSGVQCDTTAEPFINQCDYDAAGKLLTHLYGKLNNKVQTMSETESNSGKVIEIHQADYVSEGQDNTLADTGYAFVPDSCASGEECRVHIALHGCKQNAEAIDQAYITDSGLNPWAATNNIVVLYPQTKSSYAPLNPNACWDWWGYTGSKYQSRDGAQMQQVINMVEGLTEAL
uniref:extracellular catalytic domain type 2 short-chain-length polyhydroxyalkanoate depolymerase n=1 Tax=Thalassotalea litorea TaxID=2020715 RepID=UPI0037355D5A